MLVGVAGLSQIAVLVFYVPLNNYFYIAGDYYYVAGGAGIPVALAVTWYAMSLRSRALGGALVLGWVTEAATVFASELAYASPILDHVFEFWAILAYVLMAAVVVLTIIYMRKPSDLVREQPIRP